MARTWLLSVGPFPLICVYVHVVICAMSSSSASDVLDEWPWGVFNSTDTCSSHRPRYTNDPSLCILQTTHHEDHFRYSIMMKSEWPRAEESITPMCTCVYWSPKHTPRQLQSRSVLSTYHVSAEVVFLPSSLLFQFRGQLRDDFRLRACFSCLCIRSLPVRGNISPLTHYVPAHSVPVLWESFEEVF